MPRRPSITTLLFYLWPVWAFCGPHEVTAAAKERYAALECQNNGAFVLVNFFPDRTYQLTWGVDDKITEEDISVKRVHSADREIYASQNLSLSLPVGGAENSTLPRIAEFRALHPSPITWSDLRCLLYGAD